MSFTEPPGHVKHVQMSFPKPPGHVKHIQMSRSALPDGTCLHLLKPAEISRPPRDVPPLAQTSSDHLSLARIHSDGSAASRKHVNPPRHRRMGVLNPGSTSLRRASAKLHGQAAALAGPPAFHSVSTQLFASILFILRYSVPRRCSEFEFWTSPSPDPRNIMRIMLSGSSESEIWTPLDPDPRYIMQIMLSGSSEFEV